MKHAEEILTSSTVAASVVAEALRDAHKNKKAIDPIAPMIDEAPEAAYAVQEENTRYWIESGRRLSGRKIGLTSKVVQTQLGVDKPDYGMLFSDMEFVDGDILPTDRLIAPKAEAEVAFVFGKDITTEMVTAVELMSAIEYCVPAIEIVDSRIRDWKINFLDTVADNASSGLYTIGTQPIALSTIDLPRLRMRMTLDDEPVSEGLGSACLGNPLIALRWLARTMTELGRPILAGDVVLSGALGPMAPILPGQRLDLEIEGLGRISNTTSANVDQ